MVNVVSKEDRPKELVPYEVEIAKGGELMQDNNVGVVLKRRRP